MGHRARRERTLAERWSESVSHVGRLLRRSSLHTNRGIPTIRLWKNGPNCGIAVSALKHAWKNPHTILIWPPLHFRYTRFSIKGDPCRLNFAIFWPFHTRSWK